jgi:hypothetical protein
MMILTHQLSGRKITLCITCTRNLEARRASSNRLLRGFFVVLGGHVSDINSIPVIAHARVCPILA